MGLFTTHVSNEKSFFKVDLLFHFSVAHNSDFIGKHYEVKEEQKDSTMVLKNRLCSNKTHVKLLSILLIYRWEEINIISRWILLAYGVMYILLLVVTVFIYNHHIIQIPHELVSLTHCRWTPIIFSIVNVNHCAWNLGTYCSLNPSHCACLILAFFSYKESHKF